jgi:hypothetical protein
VKEARQKNEEKSRNKLLASAAVAPAMPSSQIISQVAKLDKERAVEIAAEISKRSGDTRYLEELLLSQAVALNIFGSDCLLKAGNFIQGGQVARFPELTATLAQLALRAQDQSRKTILALHELRNPKKPTQFIKTYVDKQLNTLKAEIPQPNQQQLQEDTRAPMHIGSESEAIPSYQGMEAVGEVHGAADTRRENSRIPE